MKQKVTNNKNQQQQTAAKWQAICIFKENKDIEPASK